MISYQNVKPKVDETENLRIAKNRQGRLQAVVTTLERKRHILFNEIQNNELFGNNAETLAKASGEVANILQLLGNAPLWLLDEAKN